jgi:hypothetical protein
VFHRSVRGIKARNLNAKTEELQRVIDEAVRETRMKLRNKKRAD